MLFELSDDLLRQHPTYEVGVVFVHDAVTPSLDNTGALVGALRGAAESVAWRLGGAGLHAHPASPCAVGAGFRGGRNQSPELCAVDCGAGAAVLAR